MGQKLNGQDVVSALNRIRQARGVPKFLFCDYGCRYSHTITLHRTTISLRQDLGVSTQKCQRLRAAQIYVHCVRNPAHDGEHNLGEEILGTVNLHLQAKGMRITTGTIVDATLVHAPSSTKNREQSRDPEMH